MTLPERLGELRAMSEVLHDRVTELAIDMPPGEVTDTAVAAADALSAACRLLELARRAAS